MTATGFTIDELGAMFTEMGIDPTDVASDGEAVEPIHIENAEPLPDDLPPKVAAIVAEHAEPGERSERTLALVTACVRAEFTDGQILAAALCHQPTRDRHTTEPALIADVGRCAAKARAVWAEYLDALDDFAGTDTAPATRSVNPFTAALLNWTDFWAEDRNSEQWVLDPVFAKGRGHAINAAAKTGKSLFLLEVMVRAAAGMPVLHRPGGEKLPALYVDLEMTESDVQERLEDMGFGPDIDLSAFHYSLLPSLAPLDTKEGGAELVACCLDLGVEIVGVDTISRAVAGEENNADTLRNFNRHTGSALKRHGITWWRADHTGKDLTKGARGTSAKNDDVDIVWQLTRTESGLLLKRTHSRLGWVPDRIDVTIGTDPLHHTIGGRAWPLGTSELAVTLDSLDVPLELGERKARELAKSLDPDFRATGTVLRAAIQYRREADWGAS